MVKYTKAEKIRVALCYLEENKSYSYIAKETGVAKIRIQEWVAFYKQWGAEIFDKSYTEYSPELKLEVLQYMAETGASQLDAAVKFRITSRGMIANWKKTFEMQGAEALFPKERGRPRMNKKPENKEVLTEIEQLQEKVQRLEMEITYLKKLEALVQEQEKLQTKSRRK